MQQHAEEITDGIGAMLGEALGAIAALQQKGLAFGHARELDLQLPRLACKYERWKRRKLLLDLNELLLVRIVRNLLDGLRAPTVGLQRGAICNLPEKVAAI